MSQRIHWSNSIRNCLNWTEYSWTLKKKHSKRLRKKPWRGKQEPEVFVQSWKILIDLMYEIPSDNTTKECVITKDAVEKKAEPEIIHGRPRSTAGYGTNCKSQTAEKRRRKLKWKK